jgi:hypothetical protein
MSYDLMCDSVHLLLERTPEPTSNITLGQIPPELFIPIFDHIIAFPRTTKITEELDSESKTDTILLLKRVSPSFRNSVIDWMQSRPRLIDSGFRGVGIYDPASTKFVLDFSTAGGVTDGLFM